MIQLWKCHKNGILVLVGSISKHRQYICTEQLLIVQQGLSYRCFRADVLWGTGSGSGRKGSPVHTSPESLQDMGLSLLLPLIPIKI